MKKLAIVLTVATIGIAVIGRFITRPVTTVAEEPKKITYSSDYIRYEDAEPQETSISDIYTLSCVDEHIDYVIELTNEEIDLMARVVMSEAGGLSMEGKQAVAETIINRVNSDKFPSTVSEVVYQKNQYSTANNGSVTDECYEAVYTALQYHAFPDSMFYFRDSKYHSFAYPYMQIGNMYFNTQEDLREIQ